MASIGTILTDPDSLWHNQLFSNDLNFTSTTTVTTTGDFTTNVNDGDTIRITGTTGGTNDGWYLVDTVVAGTITILNSGGVWTASGADTADVTIGSLSDNDDGTYDNNQIHIDAVNKTFYFKGGAGDGDDLSTDGSGVLGQALYSFFKDLWANVKSITKYDFPILSITNEQFEFQDGWTPDDGATVSPTDLTFTAASNTIVSAAEVSDFTEWFKVGDRLVVTGAEGAGDDDTYLISVIAGDTITVTTLAGGAVSFTGSTGDTATLTSNVVEQATENSTTRKMIRTAGWSEVDVNGNVSRRVAGVITLGTLEGTDQPYYTQSSSLTADTVNTFYTGPVNEGAKIIAQVINTATEIDFTATDTITSTGPRLDVFEVGDVITVTNTTSNNTTFTVTAVPSPYELTVTGNTVVTESPVNATLVSTNTSVFNIFVRTRGKVYADATLTDIGVTTMTYIVYRFPVSNADDLNIDTTADTDLNNVLTSSSYVASDLTFTGTTIATAAEDFVTDGFAVGDFIKISGSTDNDGFYKIASLTPSTQITIETDYPRSEEVTSMNVQSPDTNAITISAAGVTDVAPYNEVTVTYLQNPYDGSADVIIEGAWSNGITYQPGDVVQNGGDGRWYYLDQAGAGADTTTFGDTLTWTAWSKANGGGERFVNDAYYAFAIIIDGDNTQNKTTSPYTIDGGGLKETIYEWCQWALRQSDVIDLDVTRNGNIAPLLVEFVGSTLQCADGVFIDDIVPADTNNVEFNDYTGTARTYPIVVTVTVNFNSNLSTDTSAVYYVYYTDPAFDTDNGGGTADTDGTAVVSINGTPNYGVNALQNETFTITTAGNDFGDHTIVSNTADTITLGAALTDTATVNFEIDSNAFGKVRAIIVQNDSAEEVLGSVPQGADGTSVGFSYEFETSTVGGRKPNTNVNFTAVAIGLDTGQYVSASTDVTSGGGTISLVAPLERNYSNVT